MKKLFIVVLYKTKLSDSNTIKSLKANNIHLFADNIISIWDNSPEKINKKEDCKIFFGSNNVEFNHTPENLSLAVIYNKIINSHFDFDIVQIFDQDSEIRKENYNSYLEKVVSENLDLNVFLPKIFSNGNLYSPGKFWIFKGWHYKKINDGFNKDSFYTAITSGVVIRINSLKKFNVYFNEELSLYGIDTCFFTDFRKKDNSFYLMDFELEHDLSESTLNRETSKKRTKNYLECCKKTARGNLISILLINIYMLFLKILGKI